VTRAVAGREKAFLVTRAVARRATDVAAETRGVAREASRVCRILNIGCEELFFLTAEMFICVREQS
jgi:hypothetical protein